MTPLRGGSRGGLLRSTETDESTAAQTHGVCLSAENSLSSGVLYPHLIFPYLRDYSNKALL